MSDFKSLVVRNLRELADKIDAGTSKITESQAVDIFRIIAHDVMSKEQACVYLNLSRSRFDDLIRKGVIPRGRMISGFKEKVWYRDELEMCKYKEKDSK